jgi:ferredoxin
MEEPETDRKHARDQGTPLSEPLRVWIDQDLCTGDGLCVQYAPELLAAKRAAADVPPRLRLDVIDSAKECPGECIHVVRSDDGTEVAGPNAV